MAAPTLVSVYHTLYLADGVTPQANATCQIQLIAGNQGGGGFVTGSQLELSGQPFTVVTNAAGYFSIGLVPNANITPANTYYTFLLPDGEKWAFTVPATGGPFWLEPLFTVAPQPGPATIAGGVQTVTITGTGVTSSGTPTNPVFAITGGGGGGTASNLAPTAVQTANYTATAGQLVLVDTTSNTVAVQLPASPADQTQVGIKVVAGTMTAGALAHSATVLASSGTHFNTTTGSTTLTALTLRQLMVVQYIAATSVWVVVNDSLDLGQIDTRYDAIGAAAAAQAASLQVANNGSDISTPATFRTNLGLGTAATAAKAAWGASGVLNAQDATVAAIVCVIVEASGSYAVRSSVGNPLIVIWVGADAPTVGGSYAGTNDFWFPTT